MEGLAKALAEEGDGVAANTITPGARRIKPTGLSRAEEAALPERERSWGSSAALGPAFAALALLRGAPTGCRFRADRLAAAAARRGLPLGEAAWNTLAE